MPGLCLHWKLALLDSARQTREILGVSGTSQGCAHPMELLASGAWNGGETEQLVLKETEREDSAHGSYAGTAI